MRFTLLLLKKWFLLTAFLGPLFASAQPLNAKDYFLLGAAKYKCNACDRAVGDFSKAIEMQKDYAEAFYGRSLAWACIGEYKEALGDIKRAIRVEPNEVLYHQAQGRFRSMSGDAKGAVRDYKRALSIDSLCWQAWYGLALEEHKQLQFGDAKTAYDESIRLNPEFTLGFISRGKLLIDIGAYPPALANLAQAREREPEYAPIYELMAKAYLSLEMHADVIEQADIALKLDPELEMTYFYRGEAYFAMERYGDADADFARAVKQNKRFEEAWYKRGLCHDLQGDLKGAKKYYTKAIKQELVKGEYYVSRAELFVKMEKAKKAIADYSQAIPLLGGYSEDLLLKRGFLYVEEEDYQSALADFGEVSRKNPEQAEAWYGLGLAKYQEGSVSVACKDWYRAVKLGDERAADEIAKYCRE